MTGVWSKEISVIFKDYRMFGIFGKSLEIGSWKELYWRWMITIKRHLFSTWINCGIKWPNGG